MVCKYRFFFPLSIFFLVADIIGLNWRNKASPHPSKAIYEVIARSNNVHEYSCCWFIRGFTNVPTKQLSFWVATRILRHSKSIERRAATIVLFIKLAVALKTIGNLNSVVGMLGGLNHGCVQRLRRTWELVPEEQRREFAELEAFVDSIGNYRAYRTYLAELAKKNLPAIPYLGVHVMALLLTL